VAQRRTELAVSWSTTNVTSVCPAEGLPTWIAQMPGTLATNGFVKVDGATCCRANAGTPIVALNALLSRSISITIHGAVNETLRRSLTWVRGGLGPLEQQWIRKVMAPFRAYRENVFE
jgi:hypothetical protein